MPFCTPYHKFIDGVYDENSTVCIDSEPGSPTFNQVIPCEECTSCGNTDCPPSTAEGVKTTWGNSK